MSKKELRNAIRLALQSLAPQDIRSQSTRATKVLESLPDWQNARKVALYLHMDRELETTEMIDAAFRSKKRVFLPKIVKVSSQDQKAFERQSTHLQMLEVTSSQQVSDLQPQGKYQIREPTEGTNAFEVGGLDLIVVPAVAFTRECNRIGHGAGYYDSYIHEHSKYMGKVPKLVGVGLGCQLVDTIPLEPHDRAMDTVIIDDEKYIHTEN